MNNAITFFILLLFTILGYFQEQNSKSICIKWDAAPSIWREISIDSTKIIHQFQDSDTINTYKDTVSITLISKNQLEFDTLIVFKANKHNITFDLSTTHFISPIKEPSISLFASLFNSDSSLLYMEFNDDGELNWTTDKYRFLVVNNENKSAVTLISSPELDTLSIKTKLIDNNYKSELIIYEIVGQQISKPCSGCLSSPCRRNLILSNRVYKKFGSSVWEWSGLTKIIGEFEKLPDR